MARRQEGEAKARQQADRPRAESDARVAKEVAAAREGAEREARESYRIREKEIEGVPEVAPHRPQAPGDSLAAQVASAGHRSRWRSA